MIFLDSKYTRTHQQHAAPLHNSHFTNPSKNSRQPSLHTSSRTTYQQPHTSSLRNNSSVPSHENKLYHSPNSPNFFSVDSENETLLFAATSGTSFFFKTDVGLFAPPPLLRGGVDVGTVAGVLEQFPMRFMLFA